MLMGEKRVSTAPHTTCFGFRRRSIPRRSWVESRIRGYCQFQDRMHFCTMSGSCVWVQKQSACGLVDEWQIDTIPCAK
eukprot:24681_4